MKLPIFAALLSVCCSASSQHAHDPHHHSRHHPAAADPAAASPYAGMRTRSIKALSPQQIEGLKAGRGMGYALPAEMNGYPGPLHVLELADQLRLTPEQKTKTERLYAEMKREAQAVGVQLIEAEARLDRLFQERKATDALLDEATADAARIQGALRATHLRYHLRMSDLLEPAQVTEYARLRGYQ